MSNTKTFAFEIGSEEIPAFDLDDALTQLETTVPALLDSHGIEHGNIEYYTTPRRQIFIAHDVQVKTNMRVDEYKGPSKKIAFDESGNPTPALIGFARSKGVEISDLELRGDGDKAQFWATIKTDPKEVYDMLPEICLETINSIKWPKSMNWGNTREVYSRPIRWLCALFGDSVVSFNYANITSGNTTEGHRFLSRGPHIVKNADDLINVIESNYVISTQEKRKEIILQGIKKIEEKTGLTSKIPEKTLIEVINLTEYPTPMVGKFDEEFLTVPEEIIVDAMLMHQRYFPLYQSNGKLSNKFIITSNGNPENEEIIVEGNERVVAARLYDAKFFYEEDLKKPFADNVDKLKNVIFQEKLGTILDKNNRDVQLTEVLCDLANINEEDAKNAKRAAFLAKADLPSQAVIEFTSVQGIMGGYYALANGENEVVARAIKEHYCPKFSGDVIPTDVAGKIVALADKLDTVVGLIAVGEKPTGSKDPFGIRRAALGAIAIMEGGINISLSQAIDKEIEILKSQIKDIDCDSVKDEVLDFFLSRAKKLCSLRGVSPDTIEAVVQAGIVEPLLIIERASALEHARQNDKATFDDLGSAYVRAATLADQSLGIDFDDSILNEYEKELVEAVKNTISICKELINSDFNKACDELSKLRIPVDNFFDNVMVMDEDPDICKNRIKILNYFLTSFKNVANFGKFTK